MLFLFFSCATLFANTDSEKQTKDIKNKISSTVTNKDVEEFKKLLSTQKLESFGFLIHDNMLYRDYEIYKSYFEMHPLPEKIYLLNVLLKREGVLYLVRLINDGVVSEAEFSYNDNKHPYYTKNNLVCVLGMNGYFDLVREFIYKNKNPHSVCIDTNNWFETELHYAIIANDIDAVKYVLDNGYLEHIGLNFEKDLAKKHFEQWVYTEEQEKEDKEKPNPYKGKIIMENFFGEPRGFPIALSLRGSAYKHEQMRIGDNLPSFDIIKLLIDKGARGISKKKAFELLEKTKNNRKPEEYEKIKQYLQKNYPDDKPLKKPDDN